MNALSPQREAIAAVYFYGGLLLWTTSLALITTIGLWFLALMIPSALVMVFGMSGGPWPQPTANPTPNPDPNAAPAAERRTPNP